MAMMMVEGTRLDSSCIYTPTRGESYCGKTAERGQEREARVKDDHNHDKCVKLGEVKPIRRSALGVELKRSDPSQKDSKNVDSR